MAILEDIGGNGFIGGYSDPYKTKADEVEKLVSVAGMCGIEKDIKLFDYLVNLVYRNNSSRGRMQNPSKSLSEAIASPSTPEITINMGSIGESVDIGKLSEQIVNESLKQKGAFA